MFVLAAWMFTLRIRWLVAIGVVAALAGWSIRWWRYERARRRPQHEVADIPGRLSPDGLVLDVFVNGTHPLLPWLAFFCAGIVLGRLLATTWWRTAAIAGGFALFTLANLVNASASSRRALVLTSTDPFDRGLVYMMSALGTALMALRDDQLGRRALHRRPARRLVATGRADVADDLHRPRPRVQPAGRLARLDRPRPVSTPRCCSRPGSGSPASPPPSRGTAASAEARPRTSTGASARDVSDLIAGSAGSDQMLSPSNVVQVAGRPCRTPVGTTGRVAPTSRASTSRG